jgi:hypothetical protein
MPYYMFCPQLDLNRHIEILEHITSMEQNEVKTIEQILPSILERPWRMGTPPWKIVVLPLSGSRCFICFTYSHGLSDGIPGIAFHRTFLNALTGGNPSLSNHQDLIYKSTRKDLAPAFDTAKNLPISWSYLLSPLLGVYLPTFIASTLGVRGAANTITPDTWLGTPIFSKPGSNRTGVEILAIDRTTLDKALRLCRANDAKLTGLLHQFIVSALSESLPESSNIDSLASQTAINMRSAIGVKNDDMGIFVSGAFQTFPLQPKHSDSQKLPGLSKVFDWANPKSMTQILATSLNKLQDQPIGLLRYLISIRSWLLSKLGHQRDCSYEISNLMAFRPINVKSTASCEVKEMYFCQPVHVVSAPLAFNTVSVADGGALNICVDWQIGAILEEYQEAGEKDFVSRVCRHVENEFQRLVE